MSRFSDRNAPVEVGLEDDPDAPVTMTVGEVRKLKRKASLSPYGFALGLIGILLALAGMYRTEWQLFPQLVKVTDGKQGAIVTKIAESEARVDAKLTVQSAALDTKVAQYDDKIAAVGKTANRAVSLATAVKADLEPVTEQVAVINGEVVFLKANDVRLAAADSANTISVAALDTKVEAYQTVNNEANATMLRNVDVLGRRVEIAEEQVAKNGRITRLTGLGLITFGTVTGIHIIGTKGQGGGN